MKIGEALARRAQSGRRQLQNVALLMIAVYFASSTYYQSILYHDDILAAILHPTKYFSRFTVCATAAFFVLARFGTAATAGTRFHSIVWDNAAVSCAASAILFLNDQGIGGLVYAFPSSLISHFLLPVLTISYWFLFRKAERPRLGNVAAATLVPTVYIVFIDVVQYGHGLVVYHQLRTFYADVSGMLLFSAAAYTGVALIAVFGFLAKAGALALFGAVAAAPARLETGGVR